MDSIPIIQKAGWTSGPKRMGPEILFSSFDPQTIQSVTSRYSGYTISTASWLELIILISIKVNKPDFTAVQTGKYELRTVAVVQMWHNYIDVFVGSVKYEAWLSSCRFKEKCYLHLQDHISKLDFEYDTRYSSKSSEILPYTSRHQLK